MKHLKSLGDEVSAWPNIPIHPIALKVGNSGSAEVGHVHTDGSNLDSS